MKNRILVTLTALLTSSVFAQEIEQIKVLTGETYTKDALEIENQVIESTNTSFDGIFLTTAGVTTLTNVSFNDNKITINDGYSKISGGFAKITAGELSLCGDFSNNSFVATSTTNLATVYGGLFYTSGSEAKKLTLSNSVVSNNTISTNYNSQGAVFALDGDGDVTINIENSTFSSNGAMSNTDERYGAFGGVFSVVGSSKKNITVANTAFDGNYVQYGKSSSSYGGGGVAYLNNSNSSITFNDASFTNNYAKTDAKYVGGGVMYIGQAAIADFNVTKDTTYVGNYVEIAGEKSDEYGGFILMNNSATVNFNISDGAALTIGDGRVGYDSISSRTETAVINKTGAGSLIVNSSMYDYIGDLNVKEGFMEASNYIDASVIRISTPATLSIVVFDGMFGYTEMTNDGLLILKRGNDMADNSTATMVSYAGTGSVQTYGGTFADGVFTAGVSKSFVGDVVSVGTGVDNAQSVKFDDKLSLDFNVDKMGENALTINSIEAVTEIGNIEGDFIVGYSVDATYEEGLELSVVFSAYVGELEIANLLAWHKEDGSDTWVKLDTIIALENGIASIVVDGFSSYAFSQIPEPSTYALIFGAFALGFVAYRRRK